jgi:type II secretory pathway pseudopilin PulG
MHTTNQKQSAKTFRQGYTLVELLVYMLVATIVISLALSLMRTSAKGYRIGSAKTTVQEIGREVIAMSLREIGNMGFKWYIKKGPPDSLKRVDSTFIPADSSSFRFWKGSHGDSIEIRKASLNDSGQLLSIEKIRYSLRSSELTRTLCTLNQSTKAWSTPDTMVLATNVEALQFQFYNAMTKAWQDTVSGTNKKKIKAIRVFVLVSVNSNTDVQHETSFIFADDTVSANAGDGYVRRLYRDIMEVENNGLF